MEMGIGIHGEPGRERMELKTADEIVEILAVSIIEDPAYTRITRELNLESGEWEDQELTSLPFQSGDRILAFVNGMGGTPNAELYLIYRQLSKICEQKGLQIVRKLIGSYITSLEMQGCSITLLRVDDELIELWDAPVKTPALKW